LIVAVSAKSAEGENRRPSFKTDSIVGEAIAKTLMNTFENHTFPRGALGNLYAFFNLLTWLLWLNMPWLKPGRMGRSQGIWQPHRQRLG
jgi:hypothetical protein